MMKKKCIKESNNVFDNRIKEIVNDMVDIAIDEYNFEPEDCDYDSVYEIISADDIIRDNLFDILHNKKGLLQYIYKMNEKELSSNFESTVKSGLTEEQSLLAVCINFIEDKVVKEVSDIMNDYYRYYPRLNLIGRDQTV